MDRLIAIIQRQRELQADYGYKYEEMSVDERVATIQNMYVAAVQELGEALNETSWKPWTTGEPFVHSSRLLSELMDTFQFMMNMLFAAYPRLTPELLAQQLDAHHRHKVDINRRRLATNYDGISTKCLNCGRALDEVTITEIRDSAGYGQFCPCGQRVGTRNTPA